MKWFKHDSDAHENKKLVAFMAMHERAPLEAYGFYWMLLEIVARQMDETDLCEVTYPPQFLARKMGVSVRKLGEFLRNLTEIRAIDAKISEKSCTIKITKLLEKRDEHTRKLRNKTGATPNKVAQDIEVDIEEERNTTAITSPSIPAPAPPEPTVQQQHFIGIDRTRLPHIDLPSAWKDWAKEAQAHKRWTDEMIGNVWKSFSRHWTGKIGHSGLLPQEDWFIEWQNWCNRESQRGPMPEAGAFQPSTTGPAIDYTKMPDDEKRVKCAFWIDYAKNQGGEPRNFIPSGLLPFAEENGLI